MSEYDANRWLEIAAERPQPLHIPHRPPPRNWSPIWLASVGLAVLLLGCWIVGPRILEMLR